MSATSRCSSPSSATKTGSQAAPGVRPQHAEPLAVGCRRADRVVGREGQHRRHPGSTLEPKCAIDASICGSPTRARLASRSLDVDGRQARFNVVPMSLEMVRCQRLDGGPVKPRRCHRGQPGVRPMVGFCRGPMPERRRKKRLVDEPDLEVRSNRRGGGLQQCRPSSRLRSAGFNWLWSNTLRLGPGAGKHRSYYRIFQINRHPGPNAPSWFRRRETISQPHHTSPSASDGTSP